MFKIFTRWHRGSEVILDDTGVTIAADDADAAVAAAVRRGTVSGLGARRDYIDCVAIRLP